MTLLEAYILGILTVPILALGFVSFGIFFNYWSSK